MDFAHRPPVTSALVLLLGAVSAGVNLNFLAERQMVFQLSRILSGDAWRLGSLFYCGGLAFVVMTLPNVLSSSSWLETMYYKNSRSYLAMLCLLAVVSMVACSISGYPFASQPFILSLNYLEFRHNYRGHMAMLYQTLFRLMFSSLTMFDRTYLSTNAIALAASHVIYYIADVLPEISSYDLLKDLKR